jgi:hypothetical protein
MNVEFPSIVNTEKYLFVFDSEQYGSSSTAPVLQNFLVKIRCGDGWGFSSPIAMPLVGEYLASLATVMLENDELCKALYYTLNCRFSDEDITFASKVVYGKKKKYYSRHFSRVSTVSMKQYDTRWKEVNEYMDGSPNSIINILTGDYPRSTLEQYFLAEKVRTWLFADRKRSRKFSMDGAAEYVGWTHNFTQERAIEKAMSACKSALTIYREKLAFKEHLEDFTRNAMVVKLEQE